MSSIPNDWHSVELRGGPHDGEAMLLHESQHALTLYDGPTPTTYYRIGESHDLHHEDRIARLLGCGEGGRR